MNSKWTGGDIGPTGASGSGLSPSTPGSDWPPPSDGNGFDAGDLVPIPKSKEPSDQSPPAAVKGTPLT